MNLLYKNLDAVIKAPNLKIGDYLIALDKLGLGFVIITDQRRVINVITDGDLRRELLSGKTIKDRYICDKKKFIYAPINTTAKKLRLLIDQKKIKALPLVDEKRSLVAILTSNGSGKDFKGFIMAGGEGRRLRPLTLSTPKPLLKIAGQTLLHRAITSLRAAGVSNIEISINYLAEQFEEYCFKNYTEKEIKLIREFKKLGTAGSLSITKDDKKDLLVCNADLITDFDYLQLVLTGISESFDLVVAARKYCHRIPFGVIVAENNIIDSIEEKPSVEINVSAGIYFIRNKVLNLIPKDNFFDMPDLINKCLQKGYKVGSVNIDSTWLDIGRQEQFDDAIKQYE